MPVYNCASGGSGSGSSGPRYKAGDGIKIADNTISSRVSTLPDNALQINNGNLYVPIPTLTNFLPQVNVRIAPVEQNVQITATKGETILTKITDENGSVIFDNIDSFGTWTFSYVKGTDTVSQQVVISEVKLYTVTLAAAGVYGVSWNKNSSSTALTRLTPETDPNGICTAIVDTEPVAQTPSVTGYSPFDNIMPWSGMEEYNVDNSVVTYKKGDDGFSYTAQEVVVFIPQFYYCIIDTSTTRYFYVSSITFSGAQVHPGSNRYVAKYFNVSGFKSVANAVPLVNNTLSVCRTGIKGKGAGWYQIDMPTINAIQLLYMIEYADLNSQAKLGNGAAVGTGYTVQNGNTNSIDYHTGNLGNNTSIKYRNIENLWGGLIVFVDGAIISSNKLNICLDPDNFSNSVTADYTDVCAGNIANGFIRSLAWNEDYSWLIYPASVGGSSSTFIPDLLQGPTNANAIIWYGVYDPNAASGQNGIFAMLTQYTQTSSFGNTTSRSIFIPDKAS